MRDLLGSRWAFLILLLVGRMAMGFQLQAVGSVTPFLIDEFQVDYAQIGTLVGLYLLPGIVLALPGGFIGQALGDHRTLLVGAGGDGGRLCAGGECRRFRHRHGRPAGERRRRGPCDGDGHENGCRSLLRPHP